MKIHNQSEIYVVNRIVQQDDEEELKRELLTGRTGEDFTEKQVFDLNPEQ